MAARPSSCHEEEVSKVTNYATFDERVTLSINMRQILDKFTATFWHGIRRLPSRLGQLTLSQASVDPLVSLFCNGAFERFQHIINRLGRLVACLTTHEGGV